MSWFYVIKPHTSWPIRFRARGLDEAAQIQREIDDAVKAVLGDRAAGFVSVGRVESDPSNFGGATE